MSCCCFVCVFIIGQYHSRNNMSSKSGAAGEEKKLKVKSATKFNPWKWTCSQWVLLMLSFMYVMNQNITSVTDLHRGDMVHVEIIMCDSRLVINSIFWLYCLHFFCLHLMQFVLFTNYVFRQIIIYLRQFKFTQVNPIGPRPAAAFSLQNPLQREVTVSNDSGIQL